MPRSPRADLPPAVASLLDVGMALVRRAPSAQIAIARLGEAVDPETIPRQAMRDAIAREVEAAQAATLEPLGFKDVERALREAWRKPPGKVLDDLEEEPLAVRPAAQVHRAEVDGERVAVKVRRPGVERAVRNDLALLEALPAPLRSAFPNLDAVAVLRDVRESALDELDFEHEASQQRRVARALRAVDGVTVPKPHLELSTSGVLVTELAAGETLASGARPHDAGAAARALVAAFRSAALDAGLAIVDPRPTHVLIDGDELVLLGTGVARPVDRERAAQALGVLAALADEDEDRFVREAAATGVVGEDDAHAAYAIGRDLLGNALSGKTTLDAVLLRDIGAQAEARIAELARLAMVAAPQPQDLALGRMLGQLIALLARLGAKENWVALAR